MFVRSLRNPFTIIVSATGAVVAGAVALGAPVAATPATPHVVISQVYGGGGSASSTFANDYVELFNPTDSAVSLVGWSVQYASATGTSWSNLTSLSGSIEPGHFYLVGEAGGTGAALPTPDAAGAVNMSATTGKVALASSTTAFSGSCPTGPVDFVGYGTSANCSEGSGPAPTVSATIADFRRGDGTDTNDNAADFVAGYPNPRNSSWTSTESAPTVVVTSPADAATGVGTSASISVTFSEPVDVADGWVALSCSTSGSHDVTVGGGPMIFTVDHTTPFELGETCTATVTAADVSDQDTADPPDTMAADYTFGFTVVTLTPIHDIQGASHLSPYAGSSVLTSGVVTALSTSGSRGFYLQDPSPDTDDATSEGIFVYTGSTDPATLVTAGDLVRVQGNVSEYRPGGTGSPNLTVTEISGTSVTVRANGEPLPAPVLIGSTGRQPPNQIVEDDSGTGDVETSNTFDPANDGVDFYESLEGMRVSMNWPTAVGPTQTVGDHHELAVVDPDQEPSTAWSSRSTLAVTADDMNPERVLLSDQLVAAPTLPSLPVFAYFNGAITGVIGYDGGKYELQLTGTLPGVGDGSSPVETTTLTGDARHLTVATFNVENLAATDPDARFSAIAHEIVTNLGAPSLLALEEIQDDNGATNDGTVAATATLDKLVAAITAAGGPTYAYRQIDPVNNADGGAAGSNIRQVFLFRTDRGLSFVDRAGGDSTTATTVVTGTDGPSLSVSPGRVAPSNSAFTASRKPLTGEFTFNGHELFVIANHFVSKGADDPLFGRHQPPVLTSEAQRTAQATVVHDFVDQILDADANADVIVLGDLNDHPFAAPLSALRGSPAILTDLYNRLPSVERYSYIFEGNSEGLDHILVSSDLDTAGTTYDSVHMNSEYANSVTDHDPQLARVAFGAPVPTVTAVAPSAGPVSGGTTIAVTGAHFTGATAVLVGDSAETATAATSVSVVDDSHLTAVTPAAAGAGAANVYVVTDMGTSVAVPGSAFTYARVLISQVYGGGETATATYANDYVELFNAGPTDVDLSGWSVQYVSGTGPSSPTGTWTATPLSGTVAAGRYYLVAEHGNFTGTPLPTADAFGTVQMGRGAGKVALVDRTTALTGTTPTHLADLVGYGSVAGPLNTVNFWEGDAPAPSPADGTQALFRAGRGATDTDQNGNDFSLAAPFPHTSQVSVPAVAGSTPTSGLVAGGDTMTVTGTGFSAPARVLLVGSGSGSDWTVPATDVTVDSPTQITATTGAATHDGSYDVVVETPGGFSPTTGDAVFTYELPPIPTVTGVSPSSGPIVGGTSITVTGTHFTGSPQVFIGDTVETATAATGVVVTDTEHLTAVTGAAPETGTFDVFVRTDDGTSVANPDVQFTYDPLPVPTVTSLSPTSGPLAGGTTITVHGTGFLGDVAVLVGDTPETAEPATGVVVADPTQLTATTPAAATPGVVHVFVVTGGGTSTAGTGSAFTYATILISQVYGGASNSATDATYRYDYVVLFNPGTTAVDLGGWRLHYASATGTGAWLSAALSGTVPAGRHFLVQVGPAGIGGAALPPTNVAVSGFSLAAASGKVALGGPGSAFTGTCPVAPVDFVGYGSANCSEGGHAAPTLSITTALFRAGNGATDTDDNAADFTTDAPYPRTSAVDPPTATGIEPTHGLATGGTTITVTGTGFFAGARVTVGADPATGVRATVTDVTATQITATTGAAPATGTFPVFVETAAGVSPETADVQFTYDPLPAPTVTGVSPASGLRSGGTTITVTGTGFAGSPRVFIGDPLASGVEATDVHVTNGSGTELTAVTGATTLIGTFDVHVVTDGGTSPANADAQFTYLGVLISQVYAGAGSPGSTYANDYLELFNPGPADLDLAGWSVQYAPVASGTWQRTDLTGTVPAGRYYLVREATGRTGGAALPPENDSGRISIALSGKVALTHSTTTLSGICPTGVFDLVGFGSADCYEGSGPAPAGAAKSAVFRTPSSADTDDNAADFAAAAPRPRTCAIEAPTVTSVTPAAGPETGGTTITVVGTDFTADASVILSRDFGPLEMVPATHVQLTAASGATTELTAITGAALSPGAFHVFVTTPAGTSTAGSQSAFTYEEVPAPTSIGWAALDRPVSITANVNDTTAIYGHVRISGFTGTGTAVFGLQAQLGVGPYRTDPAAASGWTWTPAAFTTSVGTDDEYAATATWGTVGTFSYAYRFSVDGGTTWVYADSDGTANGYSVTRAGKATVRTARGKK